MKKIKNKSQINIVSKILADGFINDPLYLKLLNKDKDKLQSVFYNYLNMCFDSFYMVEYNNFDGVMVIFDSTKDFDTDFKVNPDLKPILDKMDNSKADDYYNDYCLLDLLCVKEKARGKGISKKLINEFLRYSNEKKLPAIVEIFNKDSISFYKKMGFKLKYETKNENVSGFILEYKNAV